MSEMQDMPPDPTDPSIEAWVLDWCKDYGTSLRLIANAFEMAGWERGWALTWAQKVMTGEIIPRRRKRPGE